jgi:DNA-binding MarR family transcriptional regulator
VFWLKGILVTMYSVRQPIEVTAYIDPMTPPRPSRTRPPADPPATVAALESDLGWAIRMLSSAFRKVGTGSVAELPGGGRGYLVLVAVSTGETPTQAVLAQQLGLDRTVMTYLLDDLEAAALVTRRPDPGDRRARQILITPEGAEALARARARLDTAEKTLLADLDEDEEGQLRGLLLRIARTAQREALQSDDTCE